MFLVAVWALAVKCCWNRLWMRSKTRRQDRLLPRTSAPPSKSPHQWHSSLLLCIGDGGNRCFVGLTVFFRRSNAIIDGFATAAIRRDVSVPRDAIATAARVAPHD
ncbi:hypothetical protein JG687_00010986 [Phytophthora cactorum]|uniref:Secreted protein n=1 Tax=Phytophthora cactorum TaxID=29920 RepID=A0A8T1U9M5_9STRA|nr:hypothetical protein JG687_00010986 [Phytophthora cactorum]